MIEVVDRTHVRFLFAQVASMSGWLKRSLFAARANII